MQITLQGGFCGSYKWWPWGPFILWQWHVPLRLAWRERGERVRVEHYLGVLRPSLEVAYHPSSGWSPVPGSWWDCGRGLVWGGNKCPGRHPLNRICQIHTTASATNILNDYQNSSIENVSYYFCYLMGEMVLLRECHLEDYVERESRRCVLGSVSRQFLFYLCHNLSPGLPHINWLFHCYKWCRGNQHTERFWMLPAGWHDAMF